MPFLQIFFGVTFMLIAWFLRKIGIFFVVFDFVYAYLSSVIVEFIAIKMDISPQIYPYYSVLTEFIIALVVALLSIKFEYSIVVIIMAWVGGFAAIHYLEIAPKDGSFNVPFISMSPFWGWYFLQSFVSLLGMLKQGVCQP